ncbi:MAG: hypothetical protein RL150_413 [Candidatus Parcubacteria bacterium]|jgi:predicted hydrocarbon binding protein
MDYVLLIGIAGAFITLVFYALQQTAKLSSESALYDTGNVIGGALLTTYALLIGSVPFAVLNAIWTIFALRDIVCYYQKKNVR